AYVDHRTETRTVPPFPDGHVIPICNDVDFLVLAFELPIPGGVAEQAVCSDVRKRHGSSQVGTWNFGLTSPEVLPVDRLGTKNDGIIGQEFDKGSLLALGSGRLAKCAFSLQDGVQSQLCPNTDA